MVLKKGMFGQSLLDIINSPEYDSLLSIFHMKKYQKKEIIFFPMCADDQVFIVKEGNVRVYLASEEKELTLSILEPGDSYSTHTRAYTQALDDCVLLICKTEDFAKIFTENPAFTSNLIKVLGDLLKNSITIITNLAFQKTDQRIKEYLISMAEEKGTVCVRGVVLEIGQDIGQIAMIIGASRQTVSTIFNEMYRLGILERINRKTIIITDMDRLKEL
ncbi:MAG TPA: Crp/Fnr family transcriptional regulator [Anaerovoracaceae bacterium]|nr:Crp/Fnr family transcriptional regulator [Anaerovoracaceae bacterium]